MVRVAQAAEVNEQGSERGQRKSAFLVALHAAFVLRQSTVLIITGASGFDLGDLLVAFGHTIAFHEDTVSFYLCELMCALAHLHDVCHLVHLDVKPENVFLAGSGHILLGDFDGAYDLLRADGPTRKDFFGTTLFIAPEVACGKAITCKSDVWSLGILTATLVMGSMSSLRKCAKSEVGGGRCVAHVDSATWLSAHNTQQFMSVEMGELLTASLQERPANRLTIDQMKKQLAFLKDVQWEEVEALALHPPFLPSALSHAQQPQDTIPPLHTAAAVGGGGCDDGEMSADRRLLLEAAFGSGMPLFDEVGKLCTRVNSLTGEKRCVEQQLDKARLREAGLTSRKIKEMLRGFDFNAPSRRSARRRQCGCTCS